MGVLQALLGALWLLASANATCPSFNSSRFLVAAQASTSTTLAPSLTLYAFDYQNILGLARINGEVLASNGMSIRAVPIRAGATCCEDVLATGTDAGGMLQVLHGPTGDCAHIRTHMCMRVLDTAPWHLMRRDTASWHLRMNCSHRDWYGTA